MAKTSLKIIFAGTADYAVPILQNLAQTEHEICAVYTQPDRPAGRGLKLQESPIKIAAKALQLNIEQPATLRDATAQAQLASFGADILVVVAYGLILPQAVLAIPRLGGINIHPSLLPRWRGATPLQQTILENDKTTGVTIIQMNEKMDAGDILLQETIPLTTRLTTGELSQQLALVGSDLLQKTLHGLAQQTITATPQASTGVTYVHKLTTEQACLDWQQSAEKIDAMIRAFNPVPGAFSFFENERIKIWQADIIESATATPGSIINFTKQGLDVATGTQAIRILECQFAGGKRLPIAAHYQARQNFFFPGKKFTPRGNDS